MLKEKRTQAAALGLAVVTTLSVLVGLDLLATQQHAAHGQTASAPATQPVLAAVPRQRPV
jgi:hypothetical protein